jgi:conjugative transposon TraM protein
MKQRLRKRKMLLILPVLVIPFLTLAFYTLGGGQGKRKMTSTNELKLTLPSSQLSEDPIMDKLGFYDKAKKDSLQLAEWMKSDPNFKVMDSSYEKNELARLTAITASKYNHRLNLSPDNYTGKKPEEEVLLKLQLLQHELDKKHVANPKEIINHSDDLRVDTDRLQRMMETMKNQEGEDAEIKQLSTVMDKILDIQHPSRVKERDREKLKPEAVNTFIVWNTEVADSVQPGFYSIMKDVGEVDVNASSAVVHDNQILVNGSIIKLRLLNDIFIAHKKIAAGNFVFGVVSLQGERLEVNIPSIRSGNSVFTVSLEVYDMDGIPGIHIPGAITRDAAKQSADNSLQLMELNALDPSLKAQATTAGVSTLKNLIGKKIKMTKVMVKAGYRVLLKNKVNQ